jgi:hypothetical protein
MGDVVNLRRIRKNKTRDEKSKVADANRLKFGRTKTERELTEATQQLSDRTLDGHQRETPET